MELACLKSLLPPMVHRTVCRTLPGSGAEREGPHISPIRLVHMIWRDPQQQQATSASIAIIDSTKAANATAIHQAAQFQTNITNPPHTRAASKPCFLNITCLYRDLTLHEHCCINSYSQLLTCPAEPRPPGLIATTSTPNLSNPARQHDELVVFLGQYGLGRTDRKGDQQ